MKRCTNFIKKNINISKQVIALWETYFEQTEGLDSDDVDDENQEIIAQE